MRADARLLAAVRCCLALLAVGWCGVAWSQAMADPTQPAAEWLAAQPKAPGAPVVEADTAPPLLQMLLVGPSRKYAIIGGQVLKIGDTYNGSTVVAIKSDSVVLQSNDVMQTLQMHPAIEKTVIKPKAPGKTGRSVSKAKKVVVKGENK